MNDDTHDINDFAGQVALLCAFFVLAAALLSSFIATLPLEPHLEAAVGRAEAHFCLFEQPIDAKIVLGTYTLVILKSLPCMKRRRT